LLYSSLKRTSSSIPSFISSDDIWDLFRMYEVELVRKLCAEITEAKDERTVQELALLLRTVVSDEVEDARTRAAFLRRKYPSVFDNKDAA
jgi:hypothetical protein